MADNDIARRGYMNVVRNPRDGVVSKLPAYGKSDLIRI